ncbi:hypothetical protein [Peribacillus frigoritolerans]|uniref:hypothetical protein n=1 Tax=Peribacillus frigoritolerans TaxID=450367 RepID=UPI003019B703
MRRHNLFIVLIIFLFIYQPPILSVNVLHIIGVFSWMYIILNNKLVSKVINFNTVLKIYIILIFFWIYLVIVTLFNENSILNTFDFLYWMFEILPICIMLCVHFSRKKYSIYDFINILLIVGTIQGVAALSAFFVPSIKDSFVNLLVNYGYSAIDLASIRMFGIASNLTFSTPILQSVLASLSIYLAINKRWNYIFFAPLLFFSAIINARTSFIIIAIGLLAIIIASKRLNFNNFIRVAITGVVLVISINFGSSLLEENSTETFDWIVTGYNEIVDLFKEGPNQTEGYFSYINSSERYILPDGFGILFGVGERILKANNYGVRSDIGYVNDIWLGGIFYSIFIYLFLILIIYKIGRSIFIDIRLAKFISILLFGTFLFSNIKGYIFTMNNMTNLLFLIFAFLVLKKN